MQQQNVQEKLKLGSERIQEGIKTEEEQFEGKKTLLTQTVQKQKQSCAWAYIMILVFQTTVSKPYLFFM